MFKSMYRTTYDLFRRYFLTLLIRSAASRLGVALYKSFVRFELLSGDFTFPLFNLLFISSSFLSVGRT